MAKLIEEKVPVEPTFILELTQSEMSALGSVICDLADEARQVTLDYPHEGEKVRPTARFRVVVQELSKILEPEPDDYDYFDWFEVVKED